jgi:phosphopantetheinyl transferase (holo-ACP synthase)
VAQIKIDDQFVYFKTARAWRADRDKNTRRRKDLQAELNRQRLKMKQFKFSSVSHTTHQGGFALSAHPVGFDIEDLSRELSPRAQKWLSRPEEMRKVKAPNRALAIWVMKEAAYKALKGPKQPLTVKEITLLSCRRLPQNENRHSTYAFTFSTRKTRHPQGQGRLIFRARSIVGIATLFTKL